MVKKGNSYDLAIARNMLTLISNKQHTPALQCIGNPVARLSGRTARLPCIPLGRGKSRSEIRKPLQDERCWDGPDVDYAAHRRNISTQTDRKLDTISTAT